MYCYSRFFSWGVVGKAGCAKILASLSKLFINEKNYGSSEESAFCYRKQGYTSKFIVAICLQWNTVKSEVINGVDQVHSQKRVTSFSQAYVDWNELAGVFSVLGQRISHVEDVLIFSTLIKNYDCKEEQSMVVSCALCNAAVACSPAKATCLVRWPKLSLLD